MINERIARCIAKLSGDGNIYQGIASHNGYVRYSNKCKVLREEFKKDIHNIFGKIPLTKGITNSGTPFIQTHRKEIVKFFLKYLNSYKSENIFIPAEIKKSNIYIKAAFLRAIYDDEGSPRLRTFRLKEWKRNISLYSSSKKLIKEIKEVLKKDFNIKSNKLYKDIRKDGRVSFALDITGKGDFELFQQKIGFSHPIKRKKLRLLLASYNNTPKKNPAGFLKLRAKLNI